MSAQLSFLQNDIASRAQTNTAAGVLERVSGWAIEPWQPVEMDCACLKKGCRYNEPLALLIN
jgi:hypothetical protein